MNIEDFIKFVTSTYWNLGIASFLVVALSAWLGKLWASRILQKEINEHSEKLASLQKTLDFINLRDVARHNNKLSTYKEAINLISLVLREIEAVASGKQTEINPDIEKELSLNRNRIYGNISLVSTQEVMNRYNDIVDYLINHLYLNKDFEWEIMRTKADALLNSMRKDLGVNDGDVTYQGNL